MPMRLLVTRPEEDAAPLIAVLEAQGHEVLHAPFLTIRFLPDAAIPQRDWAGLLFTSANGVRALSARPDFSKFQSLPVYAVGGASAKMAREAGFADVSIAGGDVVSLAALVAAKLEPQTGPLLHAAGSTVAGDLAGDLGKRGFTVHRAVLYDADATDILPDPVARALRAGTLQGVLLFSPRTAVAFGQAVVKAGLQSALSGVSAYCLSEAVARALEDLSLKRVLIAPRPEQAALLGLIGRV